MEKCKRLMGVGGDGMGLGMEVDEMREVVEGLRTCASVYLQSE